MSTLHFTVLFIYRFSPRLLHATSAVTSVVENTFSLQSTYTNLKVVCNPVTFKYLQNWQIFSLMCLQKFTLHTFQFLVLIHQSLLWLLLFTWYHSFKQFLKVTRRLPARCLLSIYPSKTSSERSFMLLLLFGGG